jgi:general stress protein 26
MSQPSVQQTQVQKPTQQVTQADVEKMKSMIKDMQYCMLTTQDANGDLRSRPMGANADLEVGADPSECYITFFTYKDSLKCHEMHAHKDKVNLSFSDPKKQNFVSISGTGSCSTDRAEMERRWSPSLNAWFPNGLDTPGISLLRVKVDKAEYWDAPSSKVAHAVSFIKGQLTGKVPDPAVHKSVSMERGKEEHKEKEQRGQQTEVKID